jgi:hypothetical protein
MTDAAGSARPAAARAGAKICICLQRAAERLLQADLGGNASLRPACATGDLCLAAQFAPEVRALKPKMKTTHCDHINILTERRPGLHRVLHYLTRIKHR